LVPPALICAILLCGVGVAFAAIPDSDGYTYVCANKQTGALRVREKGDACKNNENATRLVATQAAIPNITTYTKRHEFSVPGTPSALSGIAHFGSIVVCNAGDVATGGGFSGPGAGIGLASESIPFNSDGDNTAPPNGWAVDVVTQPNQTIQAAVFVVCQHTS
jgi:hypothetical protein